MVEVTAPAPTSLRGNAGVLDRLARPEIPLAGRSWQSYRTCGIAGLALAVAVTLALVVRSQLSSWVFAAVILAAVSTFFALVSITGSSPAPS